MGGETDLEQGRVEINTENFAQYFFDVRRHKPKPGQVMAKFTAVALFGAGPQKQDLIKLLQIDKAYQAAQVMHKIHLAKPPDCYRVCREICEDLISGMSVEDVENKEYEFVLEALFYTQKEHVPKGDPHWETLHVLKFDRENNTFKSTIEL